MNQTQHCPKCQTVVATYSNPAPTVDLIIYDPTLGIVLVQRRNAPFGYALPGGFVEVGESVENAAVREGLEETHLHLTLTGLLGVYSDPARDTRRHTISTVYTATASNAEAVHGGDDAAEARFHPLNNLPPLVFDHTLILEHFRQVLAGTRTLATI